MAENPELLDTSRCWTYLRAGTVGRVAAVVQGKLEIRPVNFAVDGGTLLVRTARGSLISRFAGLTVAFETDGVESGVGGVGPLAAWSVIAECAARAVRATDELVGTFGVPLLPWHGSPKPVFVRLEPMAMSGRRFAIADPSVWDTQLGVVRRSPSE